MSTTYAPGGYDPASPTAGVVSRWDDATRKVYDGNGVVLRDYTGAKVAHGAAYAGTWGPPLPSVWDVVGPVA